MDGTSRFRVVDNETLWQAKRPSGILPTQGSKDENHLPLTVERAAFWAEAGLPLDLREVKESNLLAAKRTDPFYLFRLQVFHRRRCSAERAEIVGSFPCAASVLFLHSPCAYLCARSMKWYRIRYHEKLLPRVNPASGFYRIIDVFPTRGKH